MEYVREKADIIKKKVPVIVCMYMYMYVCACLFVRVCLQAAPLFKGEVCNESSKGSTCLPNNLNVDFTSLL